MTVRKRYSVECDQCGAEATVHGVTRSKALRLFRKAGFDLGRGGIADLCPPCARVPAASVSGLGEGEPQ